MNSYTVHTYYTGNLRREREPKNICTQLLLLNLSCKERISHLGLKNKWLPRSCHLDMYLLNCLKNNESKMWKRKREKSLLFNVVYLRHDHLILLLLSILWALSFICQIGCQNTSDSSLSDFIWHLFSKSRNKIWHWIIRRYLTFFWHLSNILQMKLTSY